MARKKGCEGELDDARLAFRVEAAEAKPCALECVAIAGVEAVVARERFGRFGRVVKSGGDCVRRNPDRMLLADERTAKRDDDEVGSVGFVSA